MHQLRSTDGRLHAQIIAPVCSHSLEKEIECLTLIKSYQDPNNGNLAAQDAFDVYNVNAHEEGAHHSKVLPEVGQRARESVAAQGNVFQLRQAHILSLMTADLA